MFRSVALPPTNLRKTTNAGPLWALSALIRCTMAHVLCSPILPCRPRVTFRPPARPRRRAECDPSPPQGHVSPVSVPRLRAECDPPPPPVTFRPSARPANVQIVTRCRFWVMFRPPTRFAGVRKVT